jgi:hypothetical protein
MLNNNDSPITYLPELGTNLVTTLASLKVDDFSHDDGRG